ncbi:MAG TPA: CooT family nickel-binding protein [Acidobacteriota bacterium]|nr:CooT family nickel-binding protein [Acidobacteriota bacterium]
MCESAAYFFVDGKEELVLESVHLLESAEDQIHLTDMYGERKILRARIKSLSLVEHKIILEPL